MMANVRRTSMNLDLELVEQAKAELGTRGTTETVHRALEEVVRRARIERLLETTAAIFSEPPPDGFDDWNEWVEASQEEKHGP
jgi:Arc/MetJ family transcription regulator